MNGPVENTDRELYREHTDLTSEAGGYYENSVHVTIDGKIGMNVGGTVIVMPIAEWHALAVGDEGWQQCVDWHAGYDAGRNSRRRWQWWKR